ncbi:molecular chaperone TorD family protein [Halobacterium hubeiense]|uniref:molecular chaperone TorD family protein n=1 Tax=Halobacterium hubeiense TaxID=1407499 RepID=UPI003C786A43
MSDASRRDRDWDALAADVDADAAARAAVYEQLAATMTEPGDDLYAALDDDRFGAELRELVGRTALDVSVPELGTDDDYDTACARFNDLFHVGTGDGGPPVPPYETSYRDDVSWRDVNVDLARAYDYFGLEVDTETRDHHDHVRLELSFAGYLCRREAAVGDGAADARLDFHDRHLASFLDAMADRVASEPGAGVYEPLLSFAAAFADRDRADLAGRAEP